MPTFQYEALNEGGKPEKGSIPATNSEEAISKIRAQYLLAHHVKYPHLYILLL